MAAVSELETKYEGKIKFRIISANSDEGIDASMEYDFENKRHGLVAFDKEGGVKTIMPGHSYGKPDIEKNLEELLR